MKHRAFRIIIAFVLSLTGCASSSGSKVYLLRVGSAFAIAQTPITFEDPGGKIYLMPVVEDIEIKTVKNRVVGICKGQCADIKPFPTEISTYCNVIKVSNSKSTPDEYLLSEYCRISIVNGAIKVTRSMPEE